MNDLFLNIKNIPLIQSESFYIEGYLYIDIFPKSSPEANR